MEMRMCGPVKAYLYSQRVRHVQLLIHVVHTGAIRKIPATLHVKLSACLLVEAQCLSYSVPTIEWHSYTL